MSRLAPKVSKTTTTRTQTQLELTTADVLRAVRLLGFDIPDNVHVYVQVPGGGDWSNMSLDIDEDCPLIVNWQTEQVE